MRSSPTAQRFPTAQRMVRYSRPGKVASGVSERMSVEVPPGEMAPSELPGGVTPSAEMPGVMSTEMSTVMAGEVAVVAVVEAPEMSKAAKAVKAAKTMETVEAAAKAMKAATAETVKAAAAAVKTAAAAVESSAAAPKGRGFAHNPRRDSRRQGGFEHESESDRRRDGFRPFASHDALLPRPPVAEPCFARNRAESPSFAVLSQPRLLLGGAADIVNTANKILRDRLRMIEGARDRGFPPFFTPSKATLS
jgi:hypothetical protein